MKMTMTGQTPLALPWHQGGTAGGTAAQMPATVPVPLFTMGAAGAAAAAATARSGAVGGGDPRSDEAVRELAEQVYRETGERLGDGWRAVWVMSGSGADARPRKRFLYGVGPDEIKFSNAGKVVTYFEKLKERRGGSRSGGGGAAAGKGGSTTSAKKRPASQDARGAKVGWCKLSFFDPWLERLLVSTG